MFDLDKGSGGNREKKYLDPFGHRSTISRIKIKVRSTLERCKIV